MSEPRLAGGPTQDEIMAVSLSKLGLRKTSSVIEIGCGTGKVTVALARDAHHVWSVDRRPDAVRCAADSVKDAGLGNVDLSCAEAVDFLSSDRVYDSAFVGGTKHLAEILPVLSRKVRGKIVINAVLIATLHNAVSILQQMGTFESAVQVQVTRSHELAGSIMFKPVDPVFIIVGRGTAC